MPTINFTIKCRARNCRESAKASVVVVSGRASPVSAPPGWLSDRPPNYERETVAGTCPDHSETIRIA